MLYFVAAFLNVISLAIGVSEIFSNTFLESFDHCL